MPVKKNKKAFPHAMLEQVIDSWQEDYPMVFPKWPAPKKALCRHAWRSLTEEWYPRHPEFACGNPTRLVRAALRFWYQGIRYALACGHGVRYSLDGTPEPVHGILKDPATRMAGFLHAGDEACRLASACAAETGDYAMAERIYEETAGRTGNRYHEGKEGPEDGGE